MPKKENKDIVRRFIHAMNNQDLAALDQLASPEIAQRFKEGVLPWLNRTFPGHHMTITDMVAEGDKVVARLNTSGGHGGEWHGIAPTGKQWTNTGVYFLRLANGKIVELSSLFDELNHLKQLGAKIRPPR